MEIIQVSANLPTSTLARAIECVVHEYRCAEVHAVGAEAVNQAMQALVMATGYLEQEGIGVACVPKGKKVIVDNKDVTLIKLMVKVTTTPGPALVSSSDTPIKAKDLPRA